MENACVYIYSTDWPSYFIHCQLCEINCFGFSIFCTSDASFEIFPEIFTEDFLYKKRFSNEREYV